jgi:pimeloyl-ACP methyl ester carboxylesterase
MPFETVNGVRLRYDLSGSGEVPVVLVHGSWVSHHNWDPSVAALAQSFRVLTYDRRGHSESERLTGQGSVCDDVADLAALIEHLGLAPAWVVGNSFGASITLKLACERPELLRGIVAQEPPLFSLLRTDPAAASMLEKLDRLVGDVVERIGSGDHAGAAQQFCETVALEPGSWAELPEEFQQTLIENAPTFLDEENDPEARVIEYDSIKGFRGPVLLTYGDQSPPWFAPVIRKLAEALPQAETLTFEGAGHIPHGTHPDAYVAATTAFIRKHDA